MGLLCRLLRHLAADGRDNPIKEAKMINQKSPTNLKCDCGKNQFVVTISEPKVIFRCECGKSIVLEFRPDPQEIAKSISNGLTDLAIKKAMGFAFRKFGGTDAS